MSRLNAEIEAFEAAARWVGELVDAVPEAALAGPGLGEWDLRALIGHTSRALLTVEQYLAESAEFEDADSAEAYYARVAELPAAGPAAVLQRGIDAGAALGDDVGAGFAEVADRVMSFVSGQDDRLIATIVGGILLSSYLPTRTFELVVHGLDISHAAGLPIRPPAIAMRRTLDLATSLALRSGKGDQLLLALTGRGGLDQGFSVLA